MVQWRKIWVPVQETRFGSLVQEYSTCHKATKPVCHSYWACALEPPFCNYWAQVLQQLKPVYLEPALQNKRSHHSEKLTRHNYRVASIPTTSEKSPQSNETPVQPKIKWKTILKVVLKMIPPRKWKDNPETGRKFFKNNKEITLLGVFMTEHKWLAGHQVSCLFLPFFSLL